MAGDEPGGQRYLVRHDHGMGALWWWINAASAAEITATFAEVEADWPMNPPFDLGDPWLASNEVSEDEFEQAWDQATRTGN
jgi:hypothetical protein